jgi:hypothetical protein
VSLNSSRVNRAASIPIARDGVVSALSTANRTRYVVTYYLHSPTIFYPLLDCQDELCV